MSSKQLRKAERIRSLSLEYAKGSGPSATRKSKPDRLTIGRLASKVAARRTQTKAMRLKEMGVTYWQYIHSPRWREFREAYIKRRGSTECEVSGCRRDGKILHHRSYDRLGFEADEDLALVCVGCHDEAHRLARAWK